MSGERKTNVSGGVEAVQGDETHDDGESSSSYETVVYRLILPIICAFGIAGILLTLVVLSRKSMRTSTNCYLMALSVADLAFLVLLASLFTHGAAQQSQTFHIYAAYAVVMTNVTLMASIWLTVLLAIERYVAICRPFLAARVCTVPVAVSAICAVFGLAFLSRLPNFWEHRVTWYRDPTDNRSVAYVEMTDLAVDEVYVRLYPWLIDCFLASVVPFLSLLVLNVSLVREVRRSTRYLQHHVTAVSSTTQREEMQISVMLIGIVVVFFVCQAPYVVYSAIVSVRRFDEPLRALLLFKPLAVLLLALKSAVNFIVYCWFSEKFRLTLGRLFRCETLRRRCCGPCLRGRDSHGVVDANYCSVGMQTIAIHIGNE